MSIIHDYSDIARRMNQGKPQKKIHLIIPTNEVLPRLCPNCCTQNFRPTPLKHQFTCDQCGIGRFEAQCPSCWSWEDIGGRIAKMQAATCSNCGTKIPL